MAKAAQDFGTTRGSTPKIKAITLCVSITRLFCQGARLVVCCKAILGALVIVVVKLIGSNMKNTHLISREDLIARLAEAVGLIKSLFHLDEFPPGIQDFDQFEQFVKTAWEPSGADLVAPGCEEKLP